MESNEQDRASALTFFFICRPEMKQNVKTREEEGPMCLMRGQPVSSLQVKIILVVGVNSD